MAKDWITERSDVFKISLGARRFVLPSLVLFVATVVSIVAAYFGGRGVDWLTALPAWVPFVVGLFVAHMMITWAVVEYAVKLRRQIRGTRVGLSSLRKEGVDLRNRGREPILDEAIWKAWERDVKDWNDRVIATIKDVNEADAIWFSVLDVVPPPRIAPFATDPPTKELWVADRFRLYSWHDLRVCRLGEMIRELWRD